MKLSIIVAHAGSSTLKQALVSWGCSNKASQSSIYNRLFSKESIENIDINCEIFKGDKGILDAYHQGFKLALEKSDILAYFHDDLIIKEAWLSRALNEFKDPNVGLVGFGGALYHGHPNIYKIPYNSKQLGRSFYLSNVDDAEVHGSRFEGSCDVAVLDGFSLIIRREILEHTNGWPIKHLDYIGYDYWLSAITHRLGYRIRCCGIRCHHIGGQTAVALNMNKIDKYEEAHKYIYNEFRDVLPWDDRK